MLWNGAWSEVLKFSLVGKTPKELVLGKLIVGFEVHGKSKKKELGIGDFVVGLEFQTQSQPWIASTLELAIDIVQEIPKPSIPKCKQVNSLRNDYFNPVLWEKT